MDETELFLHFEVEDGADRDALAREIQARLEGLEGVGGAEAAPEETMLTGAEIVAGIAVGIAVVRGARELTAELRQLLAEVNRLVGEVRGLKRATVEVGDERVPASAVSDAQVAALASG